MNIQILTYRLKNMPAGLPQPDLSEGDCVAMVINLLPSVDNQGWAGYDGFVVAYGFTKEQSINRLKAKIHYLLIENPFIQNVETSTIEV